LGFALPVAGVADPHVALVVEGGAVDGRAGAGACLAAVRGRAEIPVVAVAALVCRLGLTLAGAGVADADIALIVEAGTVNGGTDAGACLAAIPRHAQVSIVAIAALVGWLSFALASTGVADAEVALIGRGGAIDGSTGTNTCQAGVSSRAEISVAATVSLVDRLSFALTVTCVADAQIALIVVAGAVDS